jgi:hypothetical protein
MVWPWPARPLWQAHHGLNDGEKPELFRVISPWTMTYMPLHKDLEGKAGKVWLTIDAVSTAGGDGINGENLQSFGEMPLGWS